MQTPLNNEDIERLARKRAGAKMGWYIHAMVYLAVNLFLLIVSQWGGGHHHWNVYSAAGWGLGLALHWISVFVLGRGSDWRERMVQKERERLQRHNQQR